MGFCFWIFSQCSCRPPFVGLFLFMCSVGFCSTLGRFLFCKRSKGNRCLWLFGEDLFSSKKFGNILSGRPSATNDIITSAVFVLWFSFSGIICPGIRTFYCSTIVEIWNLTWKWVMSSRSLSSVEKIPDWRRMLLWSKVGKATISMATAAASH